MATTNKTESKPKPDLRKGRVAESRYMEMRDSDIRKMLQMGHSDPLYIDPNTIPDGWEYHWGRDTVTGQIDSARMMQLQRRGWTTVSADERLDLVNPEFEGRESPLKGFIHYKGGVLMKRPKRFGEIEREEEEKASYESMVTLPVHQDMNSHKAREAGWQTKVYQNDTMVGKTKTFKD